jgi:hypothetical protein
MLEHGLLRLGCPACGFERLVAFSCKKRGFCPSCLGRRMTETACHLRERVLPEVPLRQWVCSLPWVETIEQNRGVRIAAFAIDIVSTLRISRGD